MTKAERIERLKNLVSTLNGSEFNDDGSLKMINNPIIKSIQANARAAYITSAGRVSTMPELYFNDNFPIIGMSIDEVDEKYHVLYATLFVYVKNKGKCMIPFIDI